MERDDLLNAISGQLDELQQLVKWVIGFGFVATILAIQGNDPITLLNLQLTRTQAFFVISLLYAAACAKGIGHLLRLNYLLANLAPENLMLGFSRLAAHPWLLNPFVPSKIDDWKSPQGSLALSGLVLLFWLCLSGLYALLPDEAWGAPLQILLTESWSKWSTWAQIGLVLGYMAPIGLFVAIGDFALSRVQRVINESAERIPEGQSELRSQLSQLGAALKVGADRGICVGAVFLVSVLVWSRMLQ